MTNKGYVSVHGGHSGQFCHHAKNSLAEIIEAYYQKGFKWVGITEHMPPHDTVFMYDDEREAGFTVKGLMDRFHAYMTEIKALKVQYADKLPIYTAFETEYYTGAVEQIHRLKKTHTPDYILGSIHHVKDINFDYSFRHYEDAITACSGIQNLYLHYFEEQYDLMVQVKPDVVGHFDLIRLFDTDYLSRIKHRDIMKKIERNLEFISDNNMILDFNLRALKKGATEPYLSYHILMLAKEMGIRVLPGDDSHCVNDVGNFIDKGKEILHDCGFETEWDCPF